MLKSTAGAAASGCASARTTPSFPAVSTRSRQGANYFNDAGVFLEKYIETSRHIEVQIFGNGRGGVTVLGERDCSSSAATRSDRETRAGDSRSDPRRLHAAAKRLAEKVAYRSAGTWSHLRRELRQVLFPRSQHRLQVEHGVTETVFGVDWCAGWSNSPPADPAPPPRTETDRVRWSSASTPRTPNATSGPPGIITNAVFRKESAATSG
jgi:urea carboxylase